jgi:hypothetical protein
VGDKSEAIPECCHTRGCGLDVLAPFVVCSEHVTKDALILCIESFQHRFRARLAAPLAPEAVAVSAAATAVCDAAIRYTRSDMGLAAAAVLWEAVDAYVAEKYGPGLPPRAGAGGEEK